MSFENLVNQDTNNMENSDNSDFDEIVPELYDYAVERGFDVDKGAVIQCLEVLSQYTDPVQAKEDLKNIWDAMNVDSGLKSELVDFDEEE